MHAALIGCMHGQQHELPVPGHRFSAGNRPGDLSRRLRLSRAGIAYSRGSIEARKSRREIIGRRSIRNARYGPGANSATRCCTCWPLPGARLPIDLASSMRSAPNGLPSGLANPLYTRPAARQANYLPAMRTELAGDLNGPGVPTVTGETLGGYVSGRQAIAPSTTTQTGGLANVGQASPRRCVINAPDDPAAASDWRGFRRAAIYAEKSPP